MNIQKTTLLIICCFFGGTIHPKKQQKLVFSMIMKNEAGRKLRECLEEVRHYIESNLGALAVIIDDASTDNSVEIAQEILGDKLILIRNTQSRFSNEIVLRKQQWEETIKTNPDWILNIDADQIFETKMRNEIYYLINQDEIDVWCFRLYDFWDETHYRDDQMWCAHNTYRSFLIRYKKDFNYTWKETPQHCGHFPQSIYFGGLRIGYSQMRLKHYGWAKEEDRIAKYHRYMKLDPGAKYGNQAHYDSILDPNPHLLEWVE